MKSGLVITLFFSLQFSLQAADRGVLAPVVRKTFEKKVAPLFDGRLSVEEFEVSIPARTVTVHRLSLQTPPGFGQQPMLTVARLQLKVAPMPLLQHQFVVREVVVQEPVLTFYQRHDGRLNLAFELMRLARMKNEESQPAVSINIERVLMEKGEIKFFGPAEGGFVRQIFALQALEAELSRIVLPNLHCTPSPFFLKARLKTAHQGIVSSRGEVSLGVSPVSFTADAEINGLYLEDFTYLFPRATVTPAAGYARVQSRFNCWGTYLENLNHVEINGLRLKSAGGLAGKLFLGLPCAGVARILEDETSTINLDFVVRGPFDDLKVDLKTALGAALQKSFQEKFSDRVRKVMGGFKEKVSEIFRRDSRR